LLLCGNVFIKTQNLEGHIYINGQIGSDNNTKGVEIQDIVLKMEQMKNFERVFVHINSLGGFVHVGNAIHNYLKAFDNVYTIAEGVCMSIATKIHLSAPIDKRFVQAGTEYLIHNPLFANVTGNADDFLQMAEELKPTQIELEKTYINETGLSKEAVQNLMKSEAHLTDEEIISLGFASKILPKEEFKAVALFEYKSKNENFMSEFKKKTLLAVASVLGIKPEEMANFGTQEREAQALIIETDKGTIETPFMDLMVGDPVLINGVKADPGTYVSTADGMQIVVNEEGNISEIIPATIEDPSLMTEEEIDSMKAQIESLQAENLALKTEKDSLNVEIASMKEEQVQTIASIEALKNVGSTFRPAVAVFKPKATASSEISIKERIAQKKAEAKK